MVAKTIFSTVELWEEVVGELLADWCWMTGRAYAIESSEGETFAYMSRGANPSHCKVVWLDGTIETYACTSGGDYDLA